MNGKDITAKLKDWGCDTKSALERFVGDQSLYEECTLIFYRDKDFSALAEHLKNEDVKAAFNSAHTLKGVAANLGLTPICQIINKIVELLRNGSIDEVMPYYTELMLMRETYARLIGVKE
ncbi:MAG: Hpt domain-containing protein [Clostridia bacterium]